MKKFKSLIILIITLIVIISIIIIALINIPKNENTDEDELVIDSEGDIGYELEVSNDEKIVTDMTEIVTVENCIQEYYNILNNNSNLYYGRDENGEYVKTADEEEINQNIINLLSEEYKSKNNITKENLNQYVKQLDEEVRIIALNMKELVDNPISKYAVYGRVVNMDYKQLSEFYMYVSLDIENNTFSIEPIDSNNFDQIKISNNNKSIEENDTNIYEDIGLSYEETIINSINRYKILVLSDSEKAYEYLDKDYREKRFKNINSFKEYVQDNKEIIKQINISKYMINYYDDYIEYICIDKNENYYIIKEKSLIDYTLLLDTYTIEQQETINRYNNANEQTRVGMNIEKIKQALNNKDYEYVYNKLDNTFKENNFGNYEQFVSYIKENLFEINKIEYTNVNKEGNIYVYETKITQMNEDEEEQSNSKKVTFIMKLLDDRDFVMSFNIE